MNYSEVVSELKAELQHIEAAIVALEPLAGQGELPDVREIRQTSTAAAPATSNDSATRRRRPMSAQTRRKISEALKRRHQNASQKAS